MRVLRKTGPFSSVFDPAVASLTSYVGGTVVTLSGNLSLCFVPPPPLGQVANHIYYAVNLIRFFQINVKNLLILQDYNLYFLLKSIFCRYFVEIFKIYYKISIIIVKIVVYFEIIDKI